MSTWRQEFFEALDLLTAELKRRFDQDGMKIAALRENVLIEGANSMGQQQTLELESLHLPQLISDVDCYRLDLQLKMLGDAIGDSPCHTVQDTATRVAKLHPQAILAFSKTLKNSYNFASVCQSRLLHPNGLSPPYAV
ncbi:hypothetical protein CgunFtcFv8_022304 [Champsocephalus gunnari]|uniref:Uncharacterized protein n=1 Tax=Champsocephalus gunnari TaxID=52237 RepID=A0AAN8DP95_CHAGU|nr:hypothetical protein CgunFtcFv8_022304 [Champsocephalus gunnari]